MDTLLSSFPFLYKYKAAERFLVNGKEQVPQTLKRSSPNKSCVQHIYMDSIHGKHLTPGLYIYTT
jgi:hypothetical protein